MKRGEWVERQRALPRVYEIPSVHLGIHFVLRHNRHRPRRWWTRLWRALVRR